MKRKDYQKPTMQVVELQQQAYLLAGSGQGKSAEVTATMETEWEESDI